MAKAKTRIYAVTDRTNDSVMLVRAYSPSQARSYVAEKEFSVEVAGTELCIKHIKDGYDVHDAAKPETAELFNPDTKLEVVEANITNITEVA